MVELSNGSNKFGKIHIADEVLAVIAGTAALESEGVKGGIGNMAGEIVEKFGVKNFSKGVKISFDEEAVVMDLALVIKSGYKVKETMEDVQQRVKGAIETMTGLPVSAVNISVHNLSAEKIKTEDE